MPRVNHFDRCSEGVLEAIRAGATIREAATGEGIKEPTVKGWLTRGRKEPKSMYGAFAAKVDAAFEARKMPDSDEVAMDRDELMLVASRAARSGNVQAMKLLSELLEPTTEAGDALTEFDGAK